jgi:hypothetical protein
VYCRCLMFAISPRDHEQINDVETDPLSTLHTSTAYVELQKRFFEMSKRIKQGKTLRRPAVVLDCFAGIGSAVVALKKLGISSEKIVHIEHDKVATHVCNQWHD